jgi:hypothetical protein
VNVGLVESLAPNGLGGKMAANASKSKKARNAHVLDNNPAMQKVVRGLRSMVKAAVPETKITVNSWGFPTFETKDPFCFYMAGKNHITFGFHYGTSLEDPEGLLEGTGKNMRHVKLRTVEDLEQKGLKELVMAAARLEGKPPMKGMSGKRK